MYSPFDLNATRAQQAHSSFVMSALSVSVHRVADGKTAPGNASGSPQRCNNVIAKTERAQTDTGHGAEAPSERTRLECPHCGTPSIIRSSRRMTKLTREIAYCCINPECGHTFVALTEIVRTLSPSATPDPSVHLPLSSHVRRDLLRAQMDYAQQSEHKPQFSRPVTGDLFAAGAPPAD